MPRAPHCLVVPCAGQGHINGCLLLARSLSSLGFSVSFVYFSSTYAELQQENRLPPSDHSSIQTHVVPDGFDSSQPHFPFAVTPSMREGLGQLIEKFNQHNPVTCLISDTFIPWTQDVADDYAIPRVEYWTSTAMAHLMVANMHVLVSKGYLPDQGSSTRWKSENPIMVDCIEGLPPFPIEHYPKDLRFFEGLTNPFVEFFLSLSRVKAAERILIHTLTELEPSAFEAFRLAQIPGYAIGPLIHHATSPKHDGVTENDCLKWLDSQAHSSVIYVAFGSNAMLSLHEIQELACGLEASAQPFLWVIRTDAFKDEVSEVLPQGFRERTQGRGLIIGWAPQVEVLEHAAVGGFLTHCGWNSTMESLWAGVPMLCCPRGAEQRSNCTYIAEVWKAGLELERTEDGGLDSRHVERGIRELMEESEGEKARMKAKELTKLLRRSCAEGGASKRNLEKFYEDMKSLCQL